MSRDWRWDITEDQAATADGLGCASVAMADSLVWWLARQHFRVQHICPELLGVPFDLGEELQSISPYLHERSV
jgi:hypothetical protein